MRSRRGAPLAACCLTALVLAACRGAPAPSSVPAEAPSAAAADDSSAAAVQLRELLAGMGVRLVERDASGASRLEVKGWVNQRTGPIELFACAPAGKTHESVVVLDCIPSGLHAGLLALGLVAGQPVGVEADGTRTPPQGPAVELRVVYAGEDGIEREVRAEEWIWDERRQATMPPSGWLFAGSYFQSPVGDAPAPYAADGVKSLVTTYHDSSSVLENPLDTGFDDEVYSANERAVPPVGTPVIVAFVPTR